MNLPRTLAQSTLAGLAQVYFACLNHSPEQDATKLVSLLPDLPEMLGRLHWALLDMCAFEQFTLMHLMCDLSSAIHGIYSCEGKVEGLLTGSESNHHKFWVAQRRRAHILRFFGNVAIVEAKCIESDLESSIQRVIRTTKVNCRGVSQAFVANFI